MNTTFINKPLSLFFGGLFLTQLAWAEPEIAQQNHQDMRNSAIQFLRTLPGVTGAAQISVNLPDPSLKLADCPTMEFFLPSSNYPHNPNLRLGVRCTNPQAWSLYLSATVLESKTTFVTRTAMEKGQIIKPDDLIASQSYDQHLPADLISDSQQVAGSTLIRPLPAGSLVRNHDLHTEATVIRGQTVKTIVSVDGFQITYEGQALSNATAGQSVLVRTPSKLVINGIARPGGIVELFGN